jgi:hypothetical protein
MLAWVAYGSGMASAISWVFLVAMFASFALGATSSGEMFGRINDTLVVAWGVVTLPLVAALHAMIRPAAPNLSRVATTIAIGSLVAIVVLQSLLVVGTLTFAEEIGPVSVAFLALGVSFVLSGYLGSKTGRFPHGVRMGLVAATSIGYPMWAFWLARRIDRAASPVDADG